VGKADDLARYLVGIEQRPRKIIPDDPAKPGHLINTLAEPSEVQDRVGFVLWNPFEEPASWNGELNWNGIANWSAQPALNFDGVNNYVDIPYSSSLDLTQFTIEAWILTREPTKIQGILRKSTGGYTNYYLLLENGRLKIGFTTDTVWKVSEGTTDIIKDKWYYAAGTYDGTDLKIYVNGALENAVSPATIPDTTSATTIRIADTDSARLWNGLIDEVRLYGRALDASEIDYNWNEGKGRRIPYDQTGLAGWWHIDEGLGKATKDETANENHGTIYEASWRIGFQFPFEGF